jgi:hypothetical protein
MILVASVMNRLFQVRSAHAFSGLDRLRILDVPSFIIVVSDCV